MELPNGTAETVTGAVTTFDKKKESQFECLASVDEASTMVGVHNGVGVELAALFLLASSAKIVWIIDWFLLQSMMAKFASASAKNSYFNCSSSTLFRQVIRPNRLAYGTSLSSTGPIRWHSLAVFRQSCLSAMQTGPNSSIASFPESDDSDATAKGLAKKIWAKIFITCPHLTRDGHCRAECAEPDNANW